MAEVFDLYHVIFAPALAGFLGYGFREDAYYLKAIAGSLASVSANRLEFVIHLSHRPTCRNWPTQGVALSRPSEPSRRLVDLVAFARREE
jgi:hypothetical protein